MPQEVTTARSAAGLLVFSGFLCLAVVLLAWLPAAAGSASESVTLTILGTTDLHGHIHPYDYLTARPAARGLAQVATVVKRVRAAEPHVLLLDCGDTIQGSPLAYVAARLRPGEPNPVVAAMNVMGYDAMAVGNHEFDFGLESLWQIKSQSRFPWLAANITGYYHDRRRRFEPYVIRRVAGVRVAILGLTPPALPFWQPSERYRGYRFRGLVETARRYVPRLRQRADVVIVIVHAGLGRALATREATSGLPEEEGVGDIAEQVPGIDAILFGHSHRELAGRDVKGVRIVQPKFWGQSVAELRLRLERAGGCWLVVEKQSRLIPIDATVEPDLEVLTLSRPAHEATERWLATSLAHVPVALSGRTARFEEHPLANLVQRAARQAGEADVALTAFYAEGLELAPGPLTMRHVFALYPFENQLYTVEVTAAVLRQALEHAASFFRGWPFPADTAPTDPLFHPYHFDIAGGVSYAIDLTRPVGERILDLRFQGQPLEPADKLRVAVNSYRYAGGGGYLMFRGLPILRRARKQMRDLLIDYVSALGTINPKVDNHWEIRPSAARQALLESVSTASPAAR